MSDTVNGVVEAVSRPNKGGFQAIKVEDAWYGLPKKGPPGVDKGDSVSFNFYVKDGQYKTIKGEISKKAQNAPVQGIPNQAAGKNSYQAKDDYWAAKEKHDKEVVQPRITYLAAYERAVQFAVLAVDNGAIPGLEKAKPNDRLSVLTSFVDELTNNIILKANDTAAGAKAATDFGKNNVKEEVAEEETAEENWE